MLNESPTARLAGATGTPGAETFSSQTLSTVKSGAAAYTGDRSAFSAINMTIESKIAV